jgi:hypothetical protein
MKDENPPSEPPKPAAPITMLELEEYLFAQTASDFAKRSSAEHAHAHIRESFRMHRFFVFTWLMQNGVSIPVHLVADGAHPPVGQQAPDKPVSPS